MMLRLATASAASRVYSACGRIRGIVAMRETLPPYEAMQAVTGSASPNAARASSHGFASSSNSGETIKVTFKDDKDGSVTELDAPLGVSLLELAHDNDVELEGACEGSLACSTCHVIVENPELYSRLPEPDDDENDMLDLAFGLTDTSRLGCQIKTTKELDGLIVRIPSATRNFAVDGFVPKPH